MEPSYPVEDAFDNTEMQELPPQGEQQALAPLQLQGDEAQKRIANWDPDRYGIQRRHHFSKQRRDEEPETQDALVAEENPRDGDESLEQVPYQQVRASRDGLGGNGRRS